MIDFKCNFFELNYQIKLLFRNFLANPDACNLAQEETPSLLESAEKIYRIFYTKVIKTLS